MRLSGSLSQQVVVVRRHDADGPKSWVEVNDRLMPAAWVRVNLSEHAADDGLDIMAGGFEFAELLIRCFVFRGGRDAKQFAHAAYETLEVGKAGSIETPAPANTTRLPRTAAWTRS